MLSNETSVVSRLWGYSSRVADKLKKKCLLFGLIRSQKHLKDLRLRGIVPVMGDLDNLNSLQKISGISDDILHFAPPSPLGLIDRRTINLCIPLNRREYYHND